jgi:hypothetical protein
MSLHRKSLFIIIIILLGNLFILSSLVYAQNYGFQVPRMVVDVYVEEDCAYHIYYDIDFYTEYGYSAIDIVDIGFPSDDYMLESVRAWLEGEEIYTIYVSEIIDIGVEIHLPEYINPGETKNLKVYGINPRMVYHDDEDEDYASVEFTPTWFDSSLLFGNTDLTVRLHLPPGIQPEEPRWHHDEPDMKQIIDNRVVYGWNIPNWRADGPYMVGASFPKKYVSGEIRSKPNPIWGFISGIFTFIFSILPCLIPVGIFVLIIIIGRAASRSRKMKYFPAKASVEGVGIKRGLTAPEASLLFEYPLNRVLSLVLFGLIKKGAVSIISNDPLLLKSQEDSISQDKLQTYEKEFLASLKSSGKLEEKKLRTMLIDMIKSVNKKLKGFSRKETKEYYQQIMNKAWIMLKNADTPEKFSEEFDNNAEWLFMDKDFEHKAGNIFSGRTIYTPSWWIYTQPTPSTGMTGTGGTPSISMPTLPGASFANSIVSNIRSFSNNIVSNITSFTSGVTSTTNPPPVSSGSSGGGGFSGGSSCACACACAGCACACAGGGR